MPFNDDHGTLPVSLARHVDQACASFEAAWTAGQRPRLEDFLDTVSESARPSAIRELILLDVHYRRLAGEEPQAADYQARFPDIDPEWLAEVVAARFDAQPKSSQIGASKLVESIGEGGFIGPHPQLTDEIQALLHQRLRFLGLINLIGWGLTWTHKFFRLQQTPDTIAFITVPGAVFLAFLMVLTMIVWGRRSLSLRRLRGYEVLAMLVATLFLLWENYFTIYRSGDMGGWMRRYVERDLPEMATLARHTSIVWFMVIAGYGIFIPNTWRRCAVATGSMAGTVLVMNLIFGLCDETIPRPYLFSYLAEMATWLFMAVGYSIYGSHKISVLRQEAVEARKLGQYQLKHLLGAGGMGEVYLAEHVLLKQPCAVKLIRPERVRDWSSVLRFEREVQATARLKHPNTVQIYDYGHAADGTFYYAMEYLPGLDLHKLVKRTGPLPPGRAVHLLRQVCAALREAHGVGLIHRDIKPSNIIVCERGGIPDVAKLLDFGLVQAIDSDSQTQKLTQEGTLAGTPDYMSPEQASGRHPLDARSDIYSLGAVAYFLLTGRPPFQRNNAIQVILDHLHEPVRRLTELRPELPADLEAVVLQCLEKDPARRFADAQSLDRALAHCAADGQWTEGDARQWWLLHGGKEPGRAAI